MENEGPPSWLATPIFRRSIPVLSHHMHWFFLSACAGFLVGPTPLAGMPKKWTKSGTVRTLSNLSLNSPLF